MKKVKVCSENKILYELIFKYFDTFTYKIIYNNHKIIAPYRYLVTRNNEVVGRFDDYKSAKDYIKSVILYVRGGRKWIIIIKKELLTTL